jgi:hypothetical protein
MQKVIFRLLAVCFAAMFFVTLVPTGSAQAITPSFVINDVKITPSTVSADTEIARVEVAWRYSLPQSGTEFLGAVTTSTTLQYTPPTCDRAGILITGPLSQTVVLREGTAAPSGSVTGTSIFSLVATQDAPGETPIRCTFSGKVLAAGNVPETPTSQSQGVISVKFLGLLSASVPTTIKQGGPQKQIRYDIDLTNLGNSLTNVKFALPEESAGGGWKPVAPTELVLQSAQQGGTETTRQVSFLVSTPFKNGWNNKEDTFQLTITPTSTKSEATGNDITVSVLARVRGVYVPSLEPMIMLGAVLAGAMLLRAKRDE